MRASTNNLSPHTMVCMASPVLVYKVAIQSIQIVIIIYTTITMMMMMIMTIFVKINIMLQRILITMLYSFLHHRCLVYTIYNYLQTYKVIYSVFTYAKRIVLLSRRRLTILITTINTITIYMIAKNQ